MKKPVSQIQIVGLRRSGNHAIMNWIIAHCPGNTLVMNDLRISPDYLFRGGHRAHLVRNKSPLMRLKIAIARGRGSRIARRILGEELYDSWWRVRASAFRSSHVDHLITTYEDYSLSTLFDGQNVQERDEILGYPEHKYSVLIIRDPYNMIASRIKQGTIQDRYSRWRGHKTASFSSLGMLWKQYAQEYLGNTDYLTGKKVVISYNRWFVDQRYRESILEQLNLSGPCKGIKRVTDHGGGSSFDGVLFDGSPEKMDVLGRYKYYQNDPDYRRIFQDPELTELSRAIFGDVGFK